MPKIEESDPIIKCSKCRKLLLVKDIEYASVEIPDMLSKTGLEDFAKKSKVKLDCPKCEAVVTLSECDIMRGFLEKKNLRQGEKIHNVFAP